MHVAVIDEELPYPLTSGKRIRTFNLLTRLAKTHRITFVCHRNADADEIAAAERAFLDRGIFPFVVPHAIPAKSGVGFLRRLLENLLSPLPFSVETHQSKAMRDAIAHLDRIDPPDLWHAEWTPYAHSLREARRPWVVMAHNVESLVWNRLAENEPNPLKRWYYRKQELKYERFERWAYSAATRTIAVSDVDARRIETDLGGRNVSVVDNGVDLDFFRPDPAAVRDPRRLLFLGSLDWRPNIDAVELLVGHLLPWIAEYEPGATLEVVGRKPSETMRLLLDQPGVTLHADVPDVRPHLHRAGMLVVPLRIGGGSRLKILEALAAGVPVVTTTIGVEGLRLTDEHCSIADGEKAFASAVIQAIRQPERLREKADRGREMVLADYGWDRLADHLALVWAQAAFR